MVKNDSSRKWLYHEEMAYRSGYQMIAGVDEAGRGPLAGPVVAAAVIFPEGVIIEGIEDSKRLSPQRREKLFEVITREAIDWSIGTTDHTVIDQLNILIATHLAMRKAIHKLNPGPDFILVDGFTIPDCTIKQIGIKDGDRLSQSIAAASILAKVTRDRIMEEYDHKFPGYGFARHKGYPTRDHCQAIAQYGICEIHRKSFSPIRKLAINLQKVGQ